MRSLAEKLTVAFMIVGVIGSLLVVMLVRWQTERQFRQYIQEQYVEELESYYALHGSWERLVAIEIRRRGRGSGPPGQLLRLTLTDGARRVVVSGDARYPRGTVLSARAMRRAVPITAEGATVGYLITGSLRDPGLPVDSPEIRFLNQVMRLSLLSALGAATLAALLGVVLAQTIARPVRELTAATRAVAAGDLGRQVAVRTQDEIGELATAFNQMSSDLAQATTLRRQMTADIAHDLRTPLSALLGYTEALSEGKFEGSAQLYRILHQESQHLQRLVDDLRTLSLADAGELALTPGRVAPAALLERVLLAHGAQASAQGVTLTLEADEGLPEIEADEERLVQVLNNLLRNALHHTPAGGTITLRALARPDALRLEVADTGSGIAPDELPHIWERLYRGDRARSEPGSSGLGLNIARSIVEAHGGTIRATSTLGEGSTFTVELPVAARAQGYGNAVS